MHYFMLLTLEGIDLRDKLSETYKNLTGFNAFQTVSAFIGANKFYWSKTLYISSALAIMLAES